MENMAVPYEDSDKQIGGNHYKGGYDHWDLLIDLGYGVEYFTGVATKYLLRYHRKAGIQDLRKAEHYLEKVVWAIEHKGMDPVRKDLREYTVGTYEQGVANILRAANAVQVEEIIVVRIVQRTLLARTKIEIETALEETRLLIQSIERKQNLRPARVVLDSTPGATPLKAMHRLDSQDFVTEGFMQSGDMWQCKHCKEHITVPPNTSPGDTHLCKAGDEALKRRYFG